MDRLSTAAAAPLFVEVKRARCRPSVYLKKKLFGQKRYENLLHRNLFKGKLLLLSETRPGKIGETMVE